MEYIASIDELLRICAELIGLDGTVTMHSPEYVDFEQNMNTFARRYDLVRDTRIGVCSSIQA